MGEAIRVLIIEDEAMIAWSLGDMLRTAGCNVVGIAASVDDALSIAEKEKPEVALIDIRLRGKRDGIEAARLMQQQSGQPAMQIVFLTGQGERETKKLAHMLYPTSYLVKPVIPAEIVRAVRRAAARTGRV